MRLVIANKLYSSWSLRPWLVAAHFGIPFEEMKTRLLKTVSLREMVTAEDIAEMALFVCSKVGAHVTGQALSVCGDHQVLQ